MEVKQVKTSEIKAYAKNAKKHSEEQIRAIANSIKEFGFRQPLVLDKGMEIIVGHGRFEAAKLLGMTAVPCVRADDLTEEQVKAFRIADNKTNESDWDLALLSEEIGDIPGLDMTDFGFNEAEILELAIDDSPAEIPVAQAYNPSEAARGAQTPVYGAGTEYNPGSWGELHAPAGYIPSPSGEPSREEINYYAQKAEQVLARRVIIVYSTEEEETFLKELLAQDKEKPLGVVLDVKQVVKARRSAEEPQDEETAD